MINKLITFSIFTSFFLYLFSSSISAASIAVSPGQSIQSAIISASSGDIVNVNTGTYNERINIGKSDLIVKAFGDVVTKGFDISGNSNTLDGFHIQNSTSCEAGISVSGNSNTIIHNRVEGSVMAGIQISGSNNTVEYNEVWASHQLVNGRKTCSGADADGFRFFGSGHTFRNNYIHDIWHSDHGNIDPHIDCFQTFYGNTHDVIFENNYCDLPTWDNLEYGAYGWMLQSSYNITIQNNYVRGMACVNTGSGQNSNITSRNNTCADLVINWNNSPATLVSIPPFPVPLPPPGFPGSISTPDPTSNPTTTPTPVPTLTPVPTTYPGTSWWNVNLNLNEGEQRNYTFNILNGGNYLVKAIINATDEGTNSILVNIDKEPKDPYNIWDIPLTSGLEERIASWRGSGTFEESEFVPKVFQLTSGTHTLNLVGREPGTQLQQFKLEVYAPKPGDANSDGKVDGIDYTIWLNHYNQSVSGASNGDFNNNGKVDGVDYVVWLNNYGK